MTRLLIATSNNGKFREFADLLKDEVEQALLLRDFPGIGIPAEDGATFEQNAIIKAQSAARQAGIPALADDSGLEVDYLSGKPGVFSARYAGEGATDLQNNEKLLRDLAGIPAQLRSAHFTCAIAFCQPDGSCVTFSGVLPGVILEQPRGNKGFGYDPLFLVPEYGKTFAELSLAVKNRISHRARAFAEFKEYITSHQGSL